MSIVTPCLRYFPAHLQKETRMATVYVAPLHPIKMVWPVIFNLLGISIGAALAIANHYLLAGIILVDWLIFMAVLSLNVLMIMDAVMKIAPSRIVTSLPTDAIERAIRGYELASARPRQPAPAPAPAPGTTGEPPPGPPIPRTAAAIPMPAPPVHQENLSPRPTAQPVAPGEAWQK